MADPIVIVGGGLAGAVAALCLAKHRPDVPFLLLEQGPNFGGEHIWSFFDSDLGPDERALIEPLITRSWPDHEIAFPKRRRLLQIGYNSIRSSDLHRHVLSALRPDQYRLRCQVAEVAAGHVIADGARIEARAVIDARGPRASQLELGWQKFVGRTYRFAKGHAVPRPVIMDATVSQEDGYRFVYSLPFSDTELMIEDTYYSTSPKLDVAQLGLGLDAIAGGSALLISEEQGVLPVLLGGNLSDLWPDDGPPIARLGLSGGFFHPTTGYSLPDATANALLLARQTDFSGPALHTVFRHQAAKLWNKRRFFQLLNRMLFHAAKPRDRYRVLEHFYRLPEATIRRFYAGKLTALDKLRILSGRPPVRIRAALAALRSRSA